VDSARIDQLAQKLWDYHYLNHQLQKSNCLIGLGCSDLRVAQRAAHLFLQDLAPILIFTGGLGKVTKHSWKTLEADKFSQTAVDLGVPQDKILVENQSQHTFENVKFTRKLLHNQQIYIHSAILVTKPYMERRAWATLSHNWSEVNFSVTSPNISFANYPTPEIPKDLIINLMVGDLQRLILFARQGKITPQSIPEDVLRAYQELVRLGYTKYLLEE
jgi:uncharacterized SAM-binding protein YcdF (DUF218 family)